MIYGNLNHAQFETQLKTLPLPLQHALRFLKENDMAAHEAGKFDITLGGVPMILQVLDLKTSARESLRPEIHRANIDVQLLAAGGPEMAGFYADDGSNTVDEDLLDSPRDILFYQNNANAPEGHICMQVGDFAMYFPWDVHIPAIQVGDAPADIRKIVVKVPLAACLQENK